MKMFEERNKNIETDYEHKEAVNETGKRYKEQFISRYRPSHTYIFWDRPEIEKMSAKEFVLYVGSLRSSENKKDKYELEAIIRRFVEMGKISDAVRIFMPEEVEGVMKKGGFFKPGKERMKAWRNFKKIAQENIQSAGMIP
jgi:hypothetical protein